MMNKEGAAPEKRKPLNELVEPPHTATSEDGPSEYQKNVDTEILSNLKQNRDQQQFLFTKTLSFSATLYAGAIVFAVFSKQTGVNYFMGIVAFMTPATIILSLLISKISQLNNKSSSDDPSSIGLIAKSLQEIIKAFKQPPTS